MTLDECMARVDRMKPSAFPPEEKAAWLLGLEQQMVEGFYPRYVEVGPIGPSSYPEGRDVPLRASGPWEELYVHYLGAMVDYHHQDANAYNDAMSLFNAASDEYRKHYHRTHTPRSSGGFQNL